MTAIGFVKCGLVLSYTQTLFLILHRTYRADECPEKSGLLLLKYEQLSRSNLWTVSIDTFNDERKLILLYELGTSNYILEQLFSVMSVKTLTQS